MTTTLLILLAITAIVFWCMFEFYRNRAANLEIIACDLRDQLAELAYQLDDCSRERDRLAKTNARLIAENSTLLIDLMYSERIASHARSVRRRRKDNVAGWILFSGLARPERKMRAWKELP